MVGQCRRFAFHMKDGAPTIEGLLVKSRRREFVLIDAKIVEDADRTHSLAGHVTVPRENVYVMQEIE